LKLIKIPKQLRDRRAVSAVISNIILIGAVIVIGLGVVAWTYSRSSAYRTQYSESVNSDVDKLRERVSFEYVFYNNAAKNLSVYLMNSGKVGKVNVTTAYVSYSNGSLLATFSSPQLKFLSTNSNATHLDIGQEGYFVISLSSIPLTQGTVYTVKVVTWRGSSFENTFVA
jgi:FlaG/FlaF family flagellin (archaellin)